MIDIADRPYHLSFRATRSVFPLSAEEARRLVDNYPLVELKANRLTLRGDDGLLCDIRPATLGGGRSFQRANPRPML